jgi:hypothetical protein
LLLVRGFLLLLLHLLRVFANCKFSSSRPRDDNRWGVCLVERTHCVGAAADPGRRLIQMVARKGIARSTAGGRGGRSRARSWYTCVTTVYLFVICIRLNQSELGGARHMYIIANVRLDHLACHRRVSPRFRRRLRAILTFYIRANTCFSLPCNATPVPSPRLGLEQALLAGNARRGCKLQFAECFGGGVSLLRRILANLRASVHTFFIAQPQFAQFSLGKWGVFMGEV